MKELETLEKHTLPKHTLPKRKPGKPYKQDIIPLAILIDMHVRQKMPIMLIAKTLNISHSNVCDRLRKAGIQALEAFRMHRADILALEQQRILSHITDADIKRAGIKDKAVSIGILYDKERLDRGQSTSILSYADITKDEIESEGRIRAIEDKLRSLGIREHEIVDGEEVEEEVQSAIEPLHIDNDGKNNK